MTSELLKRILHCFAITPSAKHCLHDIDSMLDYKFSSEDISIYLSNMAISGQLESAGTAVCDKLAGSHKFWKITQKGFAAAKSKVSEKKTKRKIEIESIAPLHSVVQVDSATNIKQLLDEAEAAIQSVKRILYG